MRKYLVPAALAVAALAITPVIAQSASPNIPGAQDPGRVTGGTYAADKDHTQILFGYTHFGFTSNMGLISGATGTLALDPRAPQNAKLDMEIPLSGLHTSIAKLDEHLASPDFFDAAKYPTARFTSTSVKVDGTHAEITGNLTLHGVTGAVTLDARFAAAGTNPFNKKETVSFDATGALKRSDFGMAKYVPLVSDAVELKITASFEKQ